MNRILSIISRWLPVIVWAGVIFFFSSRASLHASVFDWEDFIIKKSAHMTEYTIFTVLLYRAFLASGVGRKKAGIMALLLAVIYAGTDEFHQRFTPGRESTFRDTIFDTIGSIIAVYTVWNILPKAPQRLRNWAKSWQLI